MIKLIIPELGVIYQELNEELGIWIVFAGIEGLFENGAVIEWHIVIVRGSDFDDVMKHLPNLGTEPTFVKAISLVSLLSQAAMMFKIDAMGIDQKLDAE
jgi:hypothetical protein